MSIRELLCTLLLSFIEAKAVDYPEFEDGVLQIEEIIGGVMTVDRKKLRRRRKEKEKSTAEGSGLHKNALFTSSCNCKNGLPTRQAIFTKQLGLRAHFYSTLRHKPRAQSSLLSFVAYKH